MKKSFLLVLLMTNLICFGQRTSIEICVPGRAATQNYFGHLQWPSLCSSSGTWTETTNCGKCDDTNIVCNTNRTHLGKDVNASTGAIVRAMDDGEVITSTFSANLGNYIILKHRKAGLQGEDLYSLYLHLNTINNLTQGQMVRMGEQIGTVGSTGTSAGRIVHLHLEVRKFSGLYFPASYTGQASQNIYASGDQRYNANLNNNYENPTTFSPTIRVNFGETIYCGSVENPKQTQIIYRIPMDKTLHSSNPISRILINNQEINTNINVIDLGDGFYMFKLNVPQNLSGLSNNRSYDIKFNINFSDNSFTQGFGYQQLKFSNGNFTDPNFSKSWVSDYAKRAALYGLIGGTTGSNFGNENMPIDFGTAARLVVNAAIKLRILSNNNAGMAGAFDNTVPPNMPKGDISYFYFQILNNWGYTIPNTNTITPTTQINTGQLKDMLLAAFGINTNTTNPLVNVIDRTPSSNCSSGDNILKNKYLYRNKIQIPAKPYAEPILMCNHENSTPMVKSILTKILVNTYEFKYQVNLQALPNTNARTTATATDFQILGTKREFQSAPSGGTPGLIDISTVTMAPGDRKYFSFPDVTIGGKMVSLYWSVDGGTLEQFGGAPYFQSVYWTAPNVSSQQTFHLYYYATTDGGFASEAIIDIVVNTGISISASKTGICSGESVTLSSTNCNGTVTWRSENVNLGTGTTKTLYPTESRTYNATCKVNNVESPRSNNVSVSVTPKPLAPVVIAYPDTIDIGLSSQLDIDSSPCDGATGVISWDNGLPDGFWQTVSPVQTTVYHATCTIKGCASSAAPVQVTVKTDCVLPKLLVSSASSGISVDRIEGTLPMDVVIEGQTYKLTGNSMYIEKFPTVSTVYRVQKVTNRCGVGTATGQAYIPIVTPCMNNEPTVTFRVNTLCVGQSTIFDATGCIGTVKWYNTRDKEYGETFLGTGTSINTGILTQTTGFYASCTDNTGCESDRKGKNVFVREYINNPAIIVEPGTAVYANTKVTLGRVFRGEGRCPSQAGIRWYKDGQFIQEDGAFEVYPLQTTTYEARCANYYLCEGAPTFVTIFVNESCQAPVSTVSGTYTIDQGNSINLPVNLSGSVPYSFTFDNRQFTNITESPYYVTVSPQSSKDYEVTNLSNGCATGASNGKIVVKVIKVVAPPQISANRTQICVGQSVTLTATNCDGEVRWNNNSSISSVITVSPTQNTTYTAYCNKYDVNSGNSNEVTVIVNPIPQITLTTEKTSINSGESITLFANGCQGVVTWANGLGTGASITVSPTSDTAYSATCNANGCISPSVQISITIACSSLLNLSGTSTSVERRAIKIESRETQFLDGKNIYHSQSAELYPPFKFQANTGKTFETKMGGCGN